MILQALVHLYEELVERKKVAREGWDKAKVSHRIMLSEKGEIEGIISAKTIVAQGKKQKEISTEMWVPLPVVRSSGVKANFLCDNSSYIFGIDNKGNPERSKKCFEAAKELHQKILQNCHSETAQAILNFFNFWNPEKALENPFVARNEEDILSASNFIFQVNGRDAMEDEAICEAWRIYQEGNDKDESTAAMGRCLVTGKSDQKIAILHNKIKGVVGAQSSGANLVSFNAQSFCSYGYDDEQGKNAPVGEHAASAYVKALNYLLADSLHRKIMGDTTIVYWAEHAQSEYQDCLSALFGDNNVMDNLTLNAVMQKMREGKPAALDDIEISPNEPFYILGLAPNASRISVRFFWGNTFGQTMRNLMAHQDRMKMDGPEWESGNIPLWRTLKETANPHSQDAASSPLISGSLIRAVLSDDKYPEAVYQNIMMRIFSGKDEDADSGKLAIYKINYVKAAFIKAYLLKNGSRKWEGIIQMAVNKETKEISYVLGRLFSVLENIQEKANPGINATIKDRYFNSACATPAVTFPVLLKLSNAHLRKLDQGQAIYYSKMLQALMDKIDMPDIGTPFPKRLSLEEQGAFVLGYYQETQARYTKKEEQ